MTILQNRWYTGLVSGLVLNPHLFQVLHPTPPILQNDTALWTLQNQLPPFTLTWNTWVYTTNQFLTEYATVVPQMQFPESTFEQDIGNDNYQAWTAHLKTITPPPPQHTLPTLFRAWALLHAPSVANQGTADLSRMVLIASAQAALTPYQGPNAKPVDFAETSAQLSWLLSQSPPAGLTVDSSTTSADVSDTWTQGVNPCFFGLWTGSWSSTPLSEKFATSHVQVDFTCAHRALLTSTPGAWYNSSLLHLAYSTNATPPWPASADPTWDEVFGPEGTMQRLITSLLIVDGITATVTSDAIFDTADRTSIQQNSQSGFWPLYCPSEPTGGVVTNTVTFPQDTLQIQTTTAPGNPIVIGANVLSIAQVLGHLL
jgi:hypothetical protein